MDETHAEIPVLEAAARPLAGTGLTSAQLKAAAKVMRERVALETQRLRRITPPPDRDKPERPGA